MIAIRHINKAELEERLQKYLRSDDFLLDLNDLEYDYRVQDLPIPPAGQLRAEAEAQARIFLENIMICEMKGHLWKETADPENGTSELTCRRCGRSETLRW